MSNTTPHSGDPEPLAADVPDEGQSAPIIDLAAGEGEVVRQVANACESWGFFQVVSHGIDRDLMASAARQTRRFFQQDAAVKRDLSRTAANPWGYYDRELTKNLRDKKEIFDIGPDVAGPVGQGELWSARTPWPLDDAFRSTMVSFRASCEALAHRLLGLVCLGLTAPRDRLAAAFEPASTSFLRLNHYPVRDPLEDEIIGRRSVDGGAGADLGIHHHTDAGALTVLMQDDISGLQVWRDGDWRTVRPIAGAMVVNIGDMLQVWSNDLYRAPVHRVLAMRRQDRISLPLFYNPAYDAIVAPLETVVGLGRRPLYRPISWGEFRRRRADGDFADCGAEVQISDYRT